MRSDPPVNPDAVSFKEFMEKEKGADIDKLSDKEIARVILDQEKKIISLQAEKEKVIQQLIETKEYYRGRVAKLHEDHDRTASILDDKVAECKHLKAVLKRLGEGTRFTNPPRRYKHVWTTDDYLNEIQAMMEYARNSGEKE